jgi:dihydroorotase
MTAVTLTFRRPDDWHVHFRDGPLLAAVVPWTARSFARAVVMPNLTPPVLDAEAAAAYRDRVRAAVPGGVAFTPLMTCYLTDGTDPQDLGEGWARGIFAAAKLYPRNATTNSAAGVNDIGRLDRVFATMADIGMPLLIHGEVTDPEVDIFDREAVFIERELAPLIDRHPRLKIVFEHVTTAEAVAFVQSRPSHLAATITPHHLTISRNDIFDHGIRPHLYCLPIAKRARHRTALRRAATSGDHRFFLGTDTAPHARRDKEATCGCAGIFCAPVAIETYLEVFAEERALDRFEAFAAINGPTFYGLPLNETRVTYVRAEGEEVALTLPGRDGPGGEIVPFRAGQRPAWRIM